MDSRTDIARYGLDSEEQAFAARVAELADTAFAPHAHIWDANEQFPQENLEILATEGLTGLTLPEAYGGKARPRIYAVIALEQIAARCFATAELLQVCINGPAYALSKLGSPALQTKYLPDVIKGKSLIGIAITEEQAGSSLGEIKTRVEKTASGYILNGKKSFTTGGDTFSAFQVLARFTGEGLKGLGSVIVDAKEPFVCVERIIRKMGGNGIHEAVIRFEACPVEPYAVIIPGEEESTKGFKLTMAAYNQLRCGIAAMCLGVARSALDQIREFLNTRYQFGKPLAQFQGLKWRVAELASELEAARLLTYRAAFTEDELGFPRAVETAYAKLTASRVAVKAVNEAIQMLGSRGISKDFPVERQYREVRGWTIAGGTTEMLLDFLGGKVLSADGRQTGETIIR